MLCVGAVCHVFVGGCLAVPCVEAVGDEVFMVIEAITVSGGIEGDNNQGDTISCDGGGMASS